MCIVRNLRFKQSALKEKDSLYSIAERRVPVLGSPPAGDVQLGLPSQPLRGLLPISLLGEQRHSGCEQFAAPESITLTTRLPILELYEKEETSRKKRPSFINF